MSNSTLDKYLQQIIRGQIHGAPCLHWLHPPVSGPSLRLGHWVCPDQRGVIVLYYPTTCFSPTFPVFWAGTTVPGEEWSSLPRLPLLPFEWRRTAQAVPAGSPAGPAAARAPWGVGRRAPGTGLEAEGRPGGQEEDRVIKSRSDKRNDKRERTKSAVHIIYTGLTQPDVSWIVLTFMLTGRQEKMQRSGLIFSHLFSSLWVCQMKIGGGSSKSSVALHATLIFINHYDLNISAECTMNSERRIGESLVVQIILGTYPLTHVLMLTFWNPGTELLHLTTDTSCWCMPE